MKLLIAAIGRLKAGPERELVERYQTRFGGLSRSLHFEKPQILEFAESSQRRAEDRIVDEAKQLIAALPAGAFVIALDERASHLSSPDFARILARERDSGRAQLVFVIGGPDGISADLRARADLLLGFGAMTIPHQLVRALLLEQLYRAATLLSGHPYHRV